MYTLNYWIWDKFTNKLPEPEYITEWNVTNFMWNAHKFSAQMENICIGFSSFNIVISSYEITNVYYKFFKF